jgi:murein DD-endopeptidase MepM/ murein hydrolase activator NlpD
VQPDILFRDVVPLPPLSGATPWLVNAQRWLHNTVPRGTVSSSPSPESWTAASMPPKRRTYAWERPALTLDLIRRLLQDEPIQGVSSRTLPLGEASQGKDVSGVLRWKDLLQEAERQFGVPWEVLGAIMAIESGGNPQARSPSGAVGLMQIMPNYHAGRAAKYGGNLWDPRTNVFTAADYLAELYRRYGSWDKAAAAYFGAIDAYGNITGARDAVGTSGHRYVQLFRDTLAKLKGGGSDSGSGVKVAPGSFWSIFGGQRFQITQEYGNYNPSMYSSGHHSGIDIGAPLGTKLYSPFSGTVVQAGWNGGYGNSVTIRLPNGYLLILGHLSSVSVKPGQQVDAGSFLGLSGSTGYSTGPHVHVEMRDPSGRIVNPANYLVI